MRSKFNSLHCICGCELAAHTSLEKLLVSIQNYYGDNVTVNSNVDCSRGINNEMYITVADYHPDRVHKEMLILATGVNFQAVYSRESNQWMLAIRKPFGVYYESATTLGHDINI